MKKLAVVVMLIAILTVVLTGCTGQKITETHAYMDGGSNDVHIIRKTMEVDNKGNVISSKESEEIIHNVKLSDFLAGDY